MDYINELQKVGFNITPRTKPKELPVELVKRYNNLPADYREFLQQFELITNKDDSVWFNSIENFRKEAESEFAWNEFELQSLEALEDDKDEQKLVKEFWDNHIPIILSVKNDYQFMAVNLNKDKYGEIVYGIEPEFEEVEKVCENLIELINLFKTAGNNKYLKNFM